MANQLDELSVEYDRPQGLDTKVIAKKLPVKVGVGSVIFEIALWVLGILPFPTARAKDSTQRVANRQLFRAKSARFAKLCKARG